MAESPLIGADKSQPKPPEPGKQKPDSVSIKQISPVAVMGPMGQPGLLILGLGENSEVYVWGEKDRTWREK